MLFVFTVFIAAAFLGAAIFFALGLILDWVRKRLSQEADVIRLAIAFAIVAAFFPVIWALVYQWSPHKFRFEILSQNWSTLGTWIAGIVTPISVMAALYAILQQNRANKNQVAELLKANRWQQRMYFERTLPHILQRVVIIGLALQEKCSSFIKFYTDDAEERMTILISQVLEKKLFPEAIDEMRYQDEYQRLTEIFVEVYAEAEQLEATDILSVILTSGYEMVKEFPPLIEGEE